MAKSKVPITRTLGPIHFEDLEPHRFEDLVRQLVYDFRDWQSIESTGRSGKDAGFDIRAFERNSHLGDDELEDEEQQHPMDGHRWMIQAKREKELGPAAVRQILVDVDAEVPPFGYILAASANFSKDSFDVFREILRSKGVMDFRLWGKGELEDMLYLPKNDRILFAFFGISLTSKRRTRSTEVRSFINTKNKLFKVLGPADQEFSTEVLLRDIDDAHYPFKKEYADFDKNPRWVQRTAFQHHPLGLIVHTREYYAYVDKIKREWDFTREVDLLWHSSDDDAVRSAKREGRDRVKEVWDYLPRSKQGHFAINGFVRYNDVLLGDVEGDRVFPYPHIYVEFSPENGPFDAWFEKLSIGRETFDTNDGWKKIDFFPNDFSALKPTLKVRPEIRPEFDGATFKALREGNAEILFAIDGRYESLGARDVFQLANVSGNEEFFLRVTHVSKFNYGKFISDQPDPYNAKRLIRQQIGSDIEDNQVITVLEVSRTYRHELENAGLEPNDKVSI